MNGATRAGLIVAAAAFVTGCGFTGNLRLDPGFASFRAPSTIHQVDREFALSLGPIPLRLATMISRPILRDEPWITDTLKSVRAVRVYAYEVDGGHERVQAHIERTKDELVTEGWEAIVAVREDGGLVRALVMPLEEEMVRGIVVMYQDDEDLVLVNVIGKIRPEMLATVMDGLDIEMPEIEIELPEIEMPEVDVPTDSVLSTQDRQVAAAG
jgi:Domain of unknown function (DUF4252)